MRLPEICDADASKQVVDRAREEQVDEPCGVAWNGVNLLVRCGERWLPGESANQSGRYWQQRYEWRAARRMLASWPDQYEFTTRVTED